VASASRRRLHQVWGAAGGSRSTRDGANGRARGCPHARSHSTQHRAARRSRALLRVTSSRPTPNIERHMRQGPRVARMATGRARRIELGHPAAREGDGRRVCQERRRRGPVPAVLSARASVRGRTQNGHIRIDTHDHSRRIVGASFRRRMRSSTIEEAAAPRRAIGAPAAAEPPTSAAHDVTALVGEQRPRLRDLEHAFHPSRGMAWKRAYVGIVARLVEGDLQRGGLAGVDVGGLLAVDA
jgi:hypothetical protein